MLATHTLDQVAAGFTDRVVRAWRTAPNAPYPPAADDTPERVSPQKTTGSAEDSTSTALVTVENGGSAGGSAAVGNGAGTGVASVGAGGVRADAGGGGGADQPVRFVGHSQPVYGISWSPDGRFLLSAGGDGEVRLWDMARGRAGNAAGYVRYDGHW